MEIVTLSAHVIMKTLTFSTTRPESGEYISDAAFTDSVTEPKHESADTAFPPAVKKLTGR